MTRATVLQEVRQMRLEELYERRQRRTLTRAAAAEMLGVPERTCRRWGGRGVAGSADRPSLGPCGARGGGAADGDAVRDPVHGLDRQVLPRTLADRAGRGAVL